MGALLGNVGGGSVDKVAAALAPGTLGGSPDGLRGNLLKVAVLDTNVGLNADVDSGLHLVVVVVEDVGGGPAAKGCTRVDILIPVVVPGDVELAAVSGACGVSRASEGCLPVILELVPRDSAIVGSLGEVEKAYPLY